MNIKNESTLNNMCASRAAKHNLWYYVSCGNGTSNASCRDTTFHICVHALMNRRSGVEEGTITSRHVRGHSHSGGPHCNDSLCYDT